jgi:hypothetical protein
LIKCAAIKGAHAITRGIKRSHGPAEMEPHFRVVILERPELQPADPDITAVA